MVANAIAYLITAILLTIGIFGICLFAADKVPAEKESPVLVVSCVALVLAWICAKIGGI